MNDEKKLTEILTTRIVQNDEHAVQLSDNAAMAAYYRGLSDGLREARLLTLQIVENA